jgi:hypothetical protein
MGAIVAGLSAAMWRRHSGIDRGCAFGAARGVLRSAALK